MFYILKRRLLRHQLGLFLPISHNKIETFQHNGLIKKTFQIQKNCTLFFPRLYQATELRPKNAEKHEINHSKLYEQKCQSSVCPSSQHLTVIFQNSR